MTLENIYFISQIVAALGVMASLIFIGVQVRQNTWQAKADAAESAHRALVDWLAFTPEVAALSYKANMDWESLTPEEDVLLAAGAMRLLLNMQEAHAKWRDGSLTESRWRVWDQYALFSVVPSIVQIYERRRSMFSDEFQAFFDSKIAEAPARPKMHVFELMQAKPDGPPPKEPPSTNEEPST